MDSGGDSIVKVENLQANLSATKRKAVRSCYREIENRINGTYIFKFKPLIPCQFSFPFSFSIVLFFLFALQRGEMK